MSSLLAGLLLLGGLLGPDTPVADCHVHRYRPDPVCTPGAVNPDVTQDNVDTTVCLPGFSEQIRPPTSLTEPIKHERMASYGVADGDPHAFELDHLISLELGGAPLDPANLWPQAYAEPLGAHDKDRVENAAHRAVCDGQLPLADAQQQIAADWIALGTALGVPLEEP